MLLLQALKLSFTVLTRNIKVYDFLLKMVLDRRALFYRQQTNGHVRLVRRDYRALLLNYGAHEYIRVGSIESP